MVEMGNREDYFHFLAGLRIESHRIVFNSAELAFVAGSLQYVLAYLFPVAWIA